jgi:hypothetical protein
MPVFNGMTVKTLDESDKMNAKTLPKVQMPNRDGFINVYERKKGENKSGTLSNFHENHKLAILRSQIATSISHPSR